MTPVSDRVMNLGHFLTQNARRLPDAPALIHGDHVTTWAELQARVGALAHALIHDYGLTIGDRVLVQSANCLQMLETMFACWRIGAVWVPANFRLAPDDLAYLAQSSSAKAMFCGAQFPDHDALIARHMGRMPPEAAMARDDPA